MIWNRAMQLFDLILHTKVYKSLLKRYCCCTRGNDYQESAEHVEADEVDNGEAAAAGSLLSGVVVRLWIAQLPWQTGQHDLLPGFTCGTPDVHTGAGWAVSPHGFLHLWSHPMAANQTMQARQTPEEHQDCLRKGLKVVVAVDLSSVHHGYFAEHLEKMKKHQQTF